MNRPLTIRCLRCGATYTVLWHGTLSSAKTCPHCAALREVAMDEAVQDNMERPFLGDTSSGSLVDDLLRDYIAKEFRQGPEPGEPNL